MVETRAELPFIGDQTVWLSHDQAARSGLARKRGESAPYFACGSQVERKARSVVRQIQIYGMFAATAVSTVSRDVSR